MPSPKNIKPAQKGFVLFSFLSPFVVPAVRLPSWWSLWSINAGSLDYCFWLVGGSVNVGGVQGVLMGGFPSVIKGGRSLALHDCRAGVCVCVCSSTYQQYSNHNYVIMMWMPTQQSVPLGISFCEAYWVTIQANTFLLSNCDTCTVNSNCKSVSMLFYCSTYDWITAALCLLSPEEYFNLN